MPGSQAQPEAAGSSSCARLAIYPEYVGELEHWCVPAVSTAVRHASDASGLARDDRWSAGVSTEIPAGFDLATRSGNGHALDAGGTNGGAPSVATRFAGAPAVGEALGKVRVGIELDEDDVTALFEARGEAQVAVARAADALRREVCGDTVSYVVTRNINYTNVCYFRCGFCAFSKGKLAENLRGPAYVVPLDEIVRRCREAWDRGAVEVCLQGGIHPGFTGDYYAEICEAIKQAVPELHVHAFSALEVWQGAATLAIPLEAYLARLRDVGLSSLPGTAAEILDDEIRRIICPDKVNTEQWLEVHDTAHRAGLRSTTTIMYGSVEGPRNWARHLLRLREQQRRSGGFTEFVPLPFVHMEAPIYLKGGARPGPTFREALLMHSVARLALHPQITNIQASWVKLGVDGAQAALRAGRERSRRHADERVHLACGRREPRPGDAAGADGGGDSRARPPSPPAHDAVRDAGSGTDARLVRGGAAQRARQPACERPAARSPGQAGPSRAGGWLRAGPTTRRWRGGRGPSARPRRSTSAPGRAIRATPSTGWSDPHPRACWTSAPEPGS